MKQQMVGWSPAPLWKAEQEGPIELQDEYLWKEGGKNNMKKKLCARNIDSFSHIKTTS